MLETAIARALPRRCAHMLAVPARVLFQSASASGPLPLLGIQQASLTGSQFVETATSSWVEL